MKHKVSELEGALLDAAVAKAEGHNVHEVRDACWIVGLGTQGIIPYEPSTSWALAGPIIEREHIDVEWVNNGWRGTILPGSHKGWYAVEWGPTALIAAMRAYVSEKFGVYGDEEVELP